MVLTRPDISHAWNAECCILNYDFFFVWHHYLIRLIYLICLVSYEFMFHALNGLLKSFESQNDLKSSKI